MDTDALVLMTLCRNHHISLIQHKHRNLLGVDDLKLGTQVQDCAWRSNDNLLLQFFPSLHWTDEDNQRTIQYLVHHSLLESRITANYTRRYNLITWSNSSYICVPEQHMQVSPQDRISPSALLLDQFAERAHMLERCRGTERNSLLKHLNVQLMVDRDLLCRLHAAHTWVHLLAGFTWLSMAREKAAVLPVPDCDWAIRFWGLKPEKIN